MATGKVTKRSAESLETLTTYNHLWDTDLKGFGMRVTPKGKRVYIIQYKAGEVKKRTRRITIGVHGVLTADQARERAKSLLGEIASGKDPAETKDNAKNAYTMATLSKFFNWCEELGHRPDGSNPCFLSKNIKSKNGSGFCQMRN